MDVPNASKSSTTSYFTARLLACATARSYEPRFAADGESIIGWARLYFANP